jgi:hypothetical protein
MLTNEYWDVLATMYDTDLYGLLNILLKDSYYDEDDIIDTIKTLKATLRDYPQKEGSKTEKRLWKAKSTYVCKRGILPGETTYTDVRELTVDEAVSWYTDWAKHLNDSPNNVFTVYVGGLFYKKDGEWVRYRA